MKKIILIGFVLSICLVAEEFEKRGSFIYDKTTELLWEEIPTKEKMDWKKAMEHCKSKQLRLPNFYELSSLLDFTKIKLAVRTNRIHLDDYSYWTSSKYRGSTSPYAWDVGFYGGTTSQEKLETKKPVICVDG